MQTEPNENLVGELQHQNYGQNNPIDRETLKGHPQVYVGNMVILKTQKKV